MASKNAPTVPLSYGLLLFQQFEVLDAAGPLEMLNIISLYLNHQDIKLYVIAPSMNSLTPAPPLPDRTSQQFNGQEIYQPTHTFETAPSLDILIVPGGLGTSLPAEKIQPTLDFIRNVYHGTRDHPPLQYLFSICTGAELFAKANLLDEHKATTNKKAWERITKLTDKTHWVATARWVESGNIWTTSGVSAGTDGMVAFISKVYGDETAEQVCDIAEYFRHKSPEDDPFAAKNHCCDVYPKK